MELSTCPWQNIDILMSEGRGCHYQLYSVSTHIFIQISINAMFLANAKSDFGAILRLFYGFFRIFWKNSGFSYVNQLWKISDLLYKMRPCLLAFEKHLYIYGISIQHFLRERSPLGIVLVYYWIIAGYRTSGVIWLCTTHLKRCIRTPGYRLKRCMI